MQGPYLKHGGPGSTVREDHLGTTMDIDGIRNAKAPEVVALRLDRVPHAHADGFPADHRSTRCWLFGKLDVIRTAPSV